MLKPSEKINDVYEKHRDKDGFLYLNVNEVPSLGYDN